MFLCENIPLEFPYVTPYNIGIKAACTDDCKISLKWNQEENYEKMEQYDGSRALRRQWQISLTPAAAWRQGQGRR